MPNSRVTGLLLVLLGCGSSRQVRCAPAPLALSTSLRCRACSAFLAPRRKFLHPHAAWTGGENASPAQSGTSTAAVPSWSDLESSLESSISSPLPVSIDSVLDPSTPNFSKDHATLFRERHGWCPYSERVWLALELKGVPYDTVRIDNTGGGRPSYYGGQTPQMRWPDGRTQGESMDLVREVDERYPEYGMSLYPEGMEAEVEAKVRAWSNTFPKKSRPSSRAAYLFDWSGEPLWKSEFERVLRDTDGVLSDTPGPFFCGDGITAADVAWAPFLERYGAQLPCLHDDLDPRDAGAYPHLSAWYDAMDSVPAYACRVKGDKSSWRKVLSMAGFGNAGVPTKIMDRMEGEADVEAERPSAKRAELETEIWDEYASSRPHVARSAAAEAASVVVRNRDAIAADIGKRLSQSGKWVNAGLPSDENGLEEAMRGLAAVLIKEGEISSADSESTLSKEVISLASYLDERMCVPRDMGSMSAAAMKRLAGYM
uniref:GST C-terminal domain-containing protein n=1 Tax=Odontella aurita TaxID=265563 RepID=A0A7S4MTS2_9STRA